MGLAIDPFTTLITKTLIFVIGIPRNEPRVIYLPRFVADSSTLERKDDGAELLGSIPRHGRAHVGAQVLEGGGHLFTTTLTTNESIMTSKIIYTYDFFLLNFKLL